MVETYAQSSLGCLQECLDSDGEAVKALRAWWIRFVANARYERMRTTEEAIWHTGRDAGIKDGHAWGWREGYAAGEVDAYQRGYAAGIKNGVNIARGKP